MKVNQRYVSYLVVLTVLGGISAAADKPQKPTWLDTSLSFEQRADDLVKQMTLDEKIGQMMDVAPAIERLGVGEYNWWNECLHGVARNGFATVFPQAIGFQTIRGPDFLVAQY